MGKKITEKVYQKDLQTVRHYRKTTKKGKDEWRWQVLGRNRKNVGSSNEGFCALEKSENNLKTFLKAAKTALKGKAKLNKE